MSSPAQYRAPTILTAWLTTNVMRATRTRRDSVALIEEILSMDHVDQETRLWVGDEEFHRSKDGPFPNHIMRVSVQPSSRCAALSYMDHDSMTASLLNSFNSGQDLPNPYLIFNWETGDVFPHWSVITIADARAALLEWLQTRALPKSINWRAPFDQS